MADRSRSKITTPLRTEKLPTKGKKRKLSPRGLTQRQRETRVDIGVAFKQWRSMKAAKGWKTDAEVALSLMDITKKLPTSFSSSGADDEKIKVSRSEMQELVEQEVQATVQSRKNKLHGLIRTIQKLDRAVDYETAMKKLETRINRISERAEAAMAFMAEAQNKVPPPPSVNAITRPDEAMETSAQPQTPAAGEQSTDCEDEKGDVFMAMEQTKKALKQIKSENTALTGAIADLSAEPPPPVLTPYGSPVVKVEVKKPKEEQDMENDATAQQQHQLQQHQLQQHQLQQHQQQHQQHQQQHQQLQQHQQQQLQQHQLHQLQQQQLQQQQQQREELKAGMVKVEPLPLGESGGPEDADSKEVKLPYPPLPTNTSPAILDSDAASYSIPQRLHVRLGLIRNPAGLSVLWNTLGDDSCKPPMATYSVYMTVEKAKGSNVFPDWTCSQVVARELPDCLMISKNKPGRKVCVAVVGKDKFGRYGPYSAVETASLPE